MTLTKYYNGQFTFLLSFCRTHLRVLPPIFDQTLSAHFLKTDGARTNRFFLLKQLTPKFHDDIISDDIALCSGISELIKSENSNAINVCYSKKHFLTKNAHLWKPVKFQLTGGILIKIVTVAKEDSVCILNFTSLFLLPEGAVSSDTVSLWNFGVICFNKKIRLVLASSVFKKWALKIWS